MRECSRSWVSEFDFLSHTPPTYETLLVRLAPFVPRCWSLIREHVGNGCDNMLTQACGKNWFHADPAKIDGAIDLVALGRNVLNVLPGMREKSVVCSLQI